ncbi:hypothetical protein ACWD95_26445, partial [Streptomyces sp. NPDC005069]
RGRAAGLPEKALSPLDVRPTVHRTIRRSVRPLVARLGASAVRLGANAFVYGAGSGAAAGASAGKGVHDDHDDDR